MVQEVPSKEQPKTMAPNGNGTDEHPCFNKTAEFCRWLGLFSSIFTLILGMVHVAWFNPYLVWPSSPFYWTDDLNKFTWRDRGYSLNPVIFVDMWAPFFFGFFGIVTHFRVSQIMWISRTFFHFAGFHYFVMSYASVGYRGGLGIVVAGFHLFTCCLAIGIAFWELTILFSSPGRNNVSASMQIGRRTIGNNEGTSPAVDDVEARRSREDFVAAKPSAPASPTEARPVSQTDSAPAVDETTMIENPPSK